MYKEGGKMVNFFIWTELNLLRSQAFLHIGQAADLSLGVLAQT